MSDIRGRHILSAGAASGVGRLVALKLAALGVRVTARGSNADQLPRVVDELQAAGSERGKNRTVPSRVVGLSFLPKRR